MRKVQRIVAALASASVLVTLSACSDDGESGGEGGAISIGQVGNYSGPVPGLNNQGVGLEAWVKATNDAGGIAGREIELHTADAKGDPAAEVSQVAQLVARENVIAFAGMGLTTPSGSVPLLEKEHIPMIGGNTSDPSWAAQPNLYVPGAGLLGTFLSGFAYVPDGQSKVGLVYCKESSGCSGVKSVLDDLGLSEVVGGDLAYTAEVSLASPSFTAQCIAAKQEGVETLAVAFDGTNLVRLAKDCADQGYTPTYVFGGTIATDEVAASGVMEGAYAGQAQAPWFLTDGPMAEHRAAMEKYFPDTPVDSNTVSGWTAGVALGMALENALADDPDKELTGEDVIDGLAEIQDETFGGLTPPVSFGEEGVQEQTNCAFSIVVKDGRWTANGSEPVCPPDEIQGDLDTILAALTEG